MHKYHLDFDTTFWSCMLLFQVMLVISVFLMRIVLCFTVSVIKVSVNAVRVTVHLRITLLAKVSKISTFNLQSASHQRERIKVRECFVWIPKKGKKLLFNFCVNLNGNNQKHISWYSTKMNFRRWTKWVLIY